jgi:hypothetical protein
MNGMIAFPATTTIYESTSQNCRSRDLLVQQGVLKHRVPITRNLKLDLHMPVVAFSWRAWNFVAFHSLN